MSYEFDRSKSRIIWVDIARAVAMMLVFTGHLGARWFPQLEPLLTAIYTFHMPLFFLLSGLFFKPTVNLLNLIIKRAKTGMRTESWTLGRPDWSPHVFDGGSAQGR